jgi:hypothetical protein
MGCVVRRIRSHELSLLAGQGEGSGGDGAGHELEPVRDVPLGRVPLPVQRRLSHCTAGTLPIVAL